MEMGATLMSVLRCDLCQELIPDGKLACENCLKLASNKSFLELQRQFLPEILSSRCEITMVYIAAGASGQLSGSWHLQRIGDQYHAYCGCEIPKGCKKDRIRYHQFGTTKIPCRACVKVLDELIETTAPHLLPEKAPPSPPTPIRDGAVCSD
jgi:hypothetical protein